MSEIDPICTLILNNKSLIDIFSNALFQNLLSEDETNNDEESEGENESDNDTKKSEIEFNTNYVDKFLTGLSQTPDFRHNYFNNWVYTVVVDWRIKLKKTHLFERNEEIVIVFWLHLIFQSAKRISTEDYNEFSIVLRDLLQNLWIYYKVSGWKCLVENDDFVKNIKSSDLLHSPLSPCWKRHITSIEYMQHPLQLNNEADVILTESRQEFVDEELHQLNLYEIKCDFLLKLLTKSFGNNFSYNLLKCSAQREYFAQKLLAPHKYYKPKTYLVFPENKSKKKGKKAKQVVTADMDLNHSILPLNLSLEIDEEFWKTVKQKQQNLVKEAKKLLKDNKKKK